MEKWVIGPLRKIYPAHVSTAAPPWAKSRQEQLPENCEALKEENCRTKWVERIYTFVISSQSQGAKTRVSHHCNLQASNLLTRLN